MGREKGFGRIGGKMAGKWGEKRFDWMGRKLAVGCKKAAKDF